jgi:hypothetical protein
MICYGKRVCAGCALDLPKANFSTSQWNKKGVGLGARCRDCVANGTDPGHMAIAVRRSFSSTQAVLDKGNPFASGTFRLVAKGLFTDGDRHGQMMGAKWFKRGLSKEAAFFNADIEVNIRARNLLAAFATIGVCSRPIRLNDTEIWYKPPRATYRERGRWRTCPSYLQHAAHEEGKRVLVEAFIPGWEKFNSNSGWVSRSSSRSTTSKSVTKRVIVLLCNYCLYRVGVLRNTHIELRVGMLRNTNSRFRWACYVTPIWLLPRPTSYRESVVT